MRKILCSTQQDRIGRERMAGLAAVLKRSYAAHFGSEPLVIWCEIPRGQAWTEGRLSDGSWLMIEVADGLDQATRERAMLGIANDWARAAGVPVERLMVTLCDAPLFAEYLAANRNRMPLLPRIGYTLRLLASVVTSQRRDGYATIAADY